MINWSLTTDGGDQTLNHYDCQKFNQVFTGVPTSQTHSYGSPKIQNIFYGRERSARHSNDCTGKLYDLEMLICYGVATISRLLKIIGLFCKRAL